MAADQLRTPSDGCLMARRSPGVPHRSSDAHPRPGDQVRHRPCTGHAPAMHPSTMVCPSVLASPVLDLAPKAAPISTASAARKRRPSPVHQSIQGQSARSAETGGSKGFLHGERGMAPFRGQTAPQIRTTCNPDVADILHLPLAIGTQK